MRISLLTLAVLVLGMIIPAQAEQGIPIIKYDFGLPWESTVTYVGVTYPKSLTVHDGWVDYVVSPTVGAKFMTVTLLITVPMGVGLDLHRDKFYLGDSTRQPVEGSMAMAISYVPREAWGSAEQGLEYGYVISPDSPARADTVYVTFCVPENRSSWRLGVFCLDIPWNPPPPPPPPPAPKP